MSLYNKYRPSKLSEIWGNEEMVRCLSAILEKPRKDIPHAFLFVGPAGTGKTTSARILAHELECNGRDLNEINIADFRGIDTAREIRSKMSLLPSFISKSRVWIMDEIARATVDSQTALLKMLEDPPNHVFFALCTTDPQKLLKTIKSRCAIFTTQTLETEVLAEGLRKICNKERKRINKDLLKKIAENAGGHPRTAIVSLDKIIDLSPDQQSTHIDELESEDAQTIELCRALFKKGSWKKTSAILKGLNSEPESIRYAVVGYAKAILMKNSNEVAFDMLNIFTKKKYVDQFELIAMCCAHTHDYEIW